jgi:hypothetical protein
MTRPIPTPYLQSRQKTHNERCTPVQVVHPLRPPQIAVELINYSSSLQGQPAWKTAFQTWTTASVSWNLRGLRNAPRPQITKEVVCKFHSSIVTEVDVISSLPQMKLRLDYRLPIV